MFQESVEGVLRVFQGGFKNVSRKLGGCFGGELLSCAKLSELGARYLLAWADNSASWGWS